jgi:CubicO group peptidase (beta-lactamase class C family)
MKIRCVLTLLGSMLLAVTAGHGGGGGCPQLSLDVPNLDTLKKSAGWSTIETALEKVNKMVADASAGNKDMGVGVVMSYHGEDLHRTAAGAARYSSSGAAIPPDDDETIWRIGSVTKVIAALALLLAVDRGEVSLDAPVSSVLPAFTLSDDITFRSLASQLSGMAREHPLPCEGDLSKCNFTNAEMLEEINKGPVRWAPNIRPAYSNLGFGLLGRVLISRVCVSIATTY